MRCEPFVLPEHSRHWTLPIKGTIQRLATWLLAWLGLGLCGCGSDPLKPTPEPAIPIPFRDEFLGSRAFAGLLALIMLAGLAVVHVVGNWFERWWWDRKKRKKRKGRWKFPTQRW